MKLAYRILSMLIGISVLYAAFLAYFVRTSDKITHIIHDGFGRVLDIPPVWARLFITDDSVWAGLGWHILDAVWFFGGLLIAWLLYSLSESLPNTAQYKNTHPWRRYFARMVDTLIMGCGTLYLIIFIVSYNYPIPLYQFLASIQVQNHTTAFLFITGLLVYLILIPIEAFFLSATGETLGKSIFGISVHTQDGSKLTFSKALKRALLVFIKGNALAIPLLLLICNIAGYVRLKKTGTTSWDEATGTVVAHTEWTATRAIGSTFTVLFGFWLITLNPYYIPKRLPPVSPSDIATTNSVAPQAATLPSSTPTWRIPKTNITTESPKTQLEQSKHTLFPTPKIYMDDYAKYGDNLNIEEFGNIYASMYKDYATKQLGFSEWEAAGKAQFLKDTFFKKGMNLAEFRQNYDEVTRDDAPSPPPSPPTQTKTKMEKDYEELLVTGILQKYELDKKTQDLQAYTNQVQTLQQVNEAGTTAYAELSQENKRLQEENQRLNQTLQQLSTNQAPQTLITSAPVEPPVLTPVNKEATLQQIQITKLQANVRATPNSDGNIMGTVKQGDQLSVINKSGDYYQVGTNLGFGFLHKSTVQEMNAKAQPVPSAPTPLPVVKAVTQLPVVKKAAVPAKVPPQREVIRLSSFDPTEQTNIRVACIGSDGAAAYNRCIQDQIQQLKNAPSLRSLGLERFNPTEQTNIRVACIGSNGAAAYNRCIQDQIQQLKNAPQLVD